MKNYVIVGFVKSVRPFIALHDIDIFFQEDLFLDHLTPGEHLEYQSILRMGGLVSEKVRKQRVEEVYSILFL